MWRGILTVVALAGSLVLWAPAAHAEPMLQMQPLEYKTDLKTGERQKGFVDITNPTAELVTVELDVQGFKQVGSKGELAFFDDDRLRAGIQLDYAEADIPAHKTLRLYFIVDAGKLPSGDVFAAIFARTKSTNEVTTSVRLGTLLLLTNGAPGAREAAVESLAMPLLQVGEALTGEVTVKNTAPPQSASGFFPKIAISMWPFGARYDVNSPLVYAGNTRTIAITRPGDYFGVYKITARHGDSSKTQWVILITGYWRWLSIVLVLAVGVLTGVYIWWKRRKKLALTQ